MESFMGPYDGPFAGACNTSARGMSGAVIALPGSGNPRFLEIHHVQEGWLAAVPGWLAGDHGWEVTRKEA